MTIRIATRQSPLALWQAHHVGELLRAGDPSATVEYVTMETFADQRLDLPISELGGKGAFSKQVQARVQNGDADLAVHSAKDLQAVTPDGLTIAAFPTRGDARDCLVGARLDELTPGARVGTGSNRRRVLLADTRPDLAFSGLRGNIATRLSKLADFDAIVMAVAALDRLGTKPDVVDALPIDVMVPQVGQGALAIECRSEDTQLIERLSSIDDPVCRLEVEAERGFLVELGGDCDLPAGAHARLLVDGLQFDAVLASEDETRVERYGDLVGLELVQANGPASVGAAAAQELRARLGS